jgi:hypothetical protein
MKTINTSITHIDEIKELSFGFDPQLILLFVGSRISNIDHILSEIKSKYPVALLIGCSTAGEISDINVSDNSISLTAITFAKTQFQKVSLSIENMSQSYEVGQKITSALSQKEDLQHILVFSDGLNINGAELVKGLNEFLPTGVGVTGGLAGDGSAFEKTFIIDEVKREKAIVAIGLYGKELKIGYGSKGGWDSFGIEREVTRSEGSILYELDGYPALDIYKTFLGDKAKDLPSSGLLFPLSLREDENLPVVRTILAVDESTKSLTFAGNIPQNSYVRFMKANIDRLIDGAASSADISNKVHHEGACELAILISCVGRKLVLNQLVEEEVDAVREVLGDKAQITGFYSYGEIAPFQEFSPCQLHNQTMTITTFYE